VRSQTCLSLHLVLVAPVPPTCHLASLRTPRRLSICKNEIPFAFIVPSNLPPYNGDMGSLMVGPYFCVPSPMRSPDLLLPPLSLSGVPPFGFLLSNCGSPHRITPRRSFPNVLWVPRLRAPLGFSLRSLTPLAHPRAFFPQWWPTQIPITCRAVK